MPNWCTTEYYFQGRMEDINILEGYINEATSKKLIETDFGNVWLGNLLLKAGIDYDKTDINIRGSIDDKERVDETTYHIITTSAWVPPIGLFPFILHYLDIENVETSYFAEELNMELLWLSNPNDCKYLQWVKDYYVEFYIDEEDKENDVFSEAFSFVENHDGFLTESELIKLYEILDKDNLSDIEFKSRFSYAIIQKVDRV